MNSHNASVPFNFAMPNFFKLLDTSIIPYFISCIRGSLIITGTQKLPHLTSSIFFGCGFRVAEVTIFVYVI